MPKGNWFGDLAPFVMLAIGLTIVGWIAFEVMSDRERARYQEHRAAEYTQHAEADIQRTCVGMESSLVAECVRKVIEATNEQQRAERDLTAQQEMARWALYMVASSVITVIVTAIGLYYVRDTLLVSRKAMLHTRRIGEAQVRAYLTCVGGTFTANAKFLMLNFTIRNTGQSPATHCLIRYRPMWFSNETGETYLAEKTVEIVAIGAGREETSGGFHGLGNNDGLTLKIAESYRVNGMIINAQCTMEWVDVFGGRQVQPFFHEDGESMNGQVNRTGKLRATNIRPRVAEAQQQN